MIIDACGDKLSFYQLILNKIETANPKKIYRDTGKLLGHDYRNWMKTSFLDDFKRLVINKIDTMKMACK